MVEHNDVPRGKVLAYIKEHFLGKVVKGSRSPAGDWLGFHLDAIEKGKAVVRVVVKKDMTNPYGNIHGGMMALVMDEVIGWSVISLDSEQYYTSLNLNIDFLYAVKLGHEMTATATVIREGKKIVHVDCVIHDSDGRIAAKGSSNLVVTGMRPA